MVIKVYEAKKEYKEKDEIKYHLPEWIRILKEYSKEDYNKDYSVKPLAEKKKKKSVEDLL